MESKYVSVACISGQPMRPNVYILNWRWSLDYHSLAVLELPMTPGYPGTSYDPRLSWNFLDSPVCSGTS